MNPLLISLVIRGLKGISEIFKRSDIVLRKAILNREIPIVLPPILTGITKQDVRDYFKRPENRDRFSDENEFPGFSKSLDIVNLSWEKAKEAGLIENETEYLTHLGILKQLIILHDTDYTKSDELVKLIEGKKLITVSNLPPQDRQEVILGFFMVGTARAGTEFVASRITLVIVDVLAEIGSDYITQVVKDKEIANVLRSFLSVFSEPDLEALETDEFLRHILKATLKTVSDNAEIITDNQLLESLIKSVAKEASEDVKALLAGKLYNRLVTVILEETAKHTSIFIELLSNLVYGITYPSSKSS